MTTFVSDRPRCSVHPGRILPCERCTPGARTLHHESNLTSDPALTAPWSGTSEYQPQVKVEVHVSTTTMQPLDGILWTDLDADTELPIRIAVSGSVDYTRDVLERIGLTGMEPGYLIVLTVGVKVRDMGLGEDAKERRRGRLALALQSVNAAQIVRAEE